VAVCSAGATRSGSDGRRQSRSARRFRADRCGTPARGRAACGALTNLEACIVGHSSLLLLFRTRPPDAEVMWTVAEAIANGGRDRAATARDRRQPRRRRRSRPRTASRARRRDAGGFRRDLEGDTSSRAFSRLPRRLRVSRRRAARVAPAAASGAAKARSGRLVCNRRFDRGLLSDRIAGRMEHHRPLVAAVLGSVEESSGTDRCR